jgi:hypothetical protein
MYTENYTAVAWRIIIERMAVISPLYKVYVNVYVKYNFSRRFSQNCEKDY